MAILFEMTEEYKEFLENKYDITFEGSFKDKRNNKEYEKKENKREYLVGYYKRMSEAEDKDFKKQLEYIKEFKKEGPNGKTMVRMYGKLDDKSAMDEYGKTIKELFEDELIEINTDINISRARHIAFTKAYKTLMSLDLNTVKIRDINKIAKRIIIDSFNNDDDDIIYY